MLIKIQRIFFDLLHIKYQKLKKISLNRLEVYMNIKNLATWTSWTGLDPEFISDQQSTPQVRSFTFGLKLDL